MILQIFVPLYRGKISILVAPERAPCYPGLGLQIPRQTVPGNLDITPWWCNPETEYAFLGFSYEVTSCRILHLSAVPGLRLIILQVKVEPSSRRTS